MLVGKSSSLMWPTRGVPTGPMQSAVSTALQLIAHKCLR